MNAHALAAVVVVVVVVVATASCSSSRCDDFATLAFDVAGHSAESCSVVLTPAGPNASSSAEYDFPAPTNVATCDGGPCTRATCTAVGGVTASYCARTLDAQHDRIALQFEGTAVAALVSLVGRDFSASLRCGASPVVDHEKHSVDCLSAAR